MKKAKEEITEDRIITIPGTAKRPQEKNEDEITKKTKKVKDDPDKKGHLITSNLTFKDLGGIDVTFQ